MDTHQGLLECLPCGWQLVGIMEDAKGVVSALEQ